MSEVAIRRNSTVLDTFLDVMVADNFRTCFELIAGEDSSCWDIREELISDPRTLVAGSDAGAHVDMVCGATYTTTLLGPCVRDKGIVSLEEAVHLLNQAPAQLYGLRKSRSH